MYIIYIYIEILGYIPWNTLSDALSGYAHRLDDLKLDNPRAESFCQILIAQLLVNPGIAAHIYIYIYIYKIREISNHILIFLVIFR